VRAFISRAFLIKAMSELTLEHIRGLAFVLPYFEKSFRDEILNMIGASLSEIARSSIL
jgi:hypothetical protein